MIDKTLREAAEQTVRKCAAYARQIHESAGVEVSQEATVMRNVAVELAIIVSDLRAALTDNTDAPEGSWEEILTAATLYISALKYLDEGHRKNDGYERIMAIRDSVNVQEDRWQKALNRLDAQQKGG